MERGVSGGRVEARLAVDKPCSCLAICVRREVRVVWRSEIPGNKIPDGGKQRNNKKKVVREVQTSQPGPEPGHMGIGHDSCWARGRRAKRPLLARIFFTTLHYSTLPFFYHHRVEHRPTDRPADRWPRLLNYLLVILFARRKIFLFLLFYFSYHSCYFFSLLAPSVVRPYRLLEDDPSQPCQSEPASGAEWGFLGPLGGFA